MTVLTSAEAPAADLAGRLQEHHRRCRPALARLRATAGEALTAQPGGHLADAMASVLAELRAADQVLLGAQPGAGRRAAMSRFMSGRFNRLAITADDVAAAVAAGDIAAIRRLLYQFHALAVALRKVQLGICPPDARPPHDGKPTDVRRLTAS